MFGCSRLQNKFEDLPKQPTNTNRAICKRVLHIVGGDVINATCEKSVLNNFIIRYLLSK